jgi:hypothetical protein
MLTEAQEAVTAVVVPEGIKFACFINDVKIGISKFQDYFEYHYARRDLKALNGFNISKFEYEGGFLLPVKPPQEVKPRDISSDNEEGLKVDPDAIRSLEEAFAIRNVGYVAKEEVRRRGRPPKVARQVIMQVGSIKNVISDDESITAELSVSERKALKIAFNSKTTIHGDTPIEALEDLSQAYNIPYKVAYEVAYS